MAKPRRKRIPSRSKSVRKVVPIDLIKVTDKYKKKIQENLKEKNRDSLSDKVVIEILMKSINEMPEKELLKIVLKKIPKKYRKT